MKKFLIIIFVACLSFSNYSQEFTGLGVNVSAHSSYYKLVEYRSDKILGLDVGFQYDSWINNVIMFRTGLSYLTLGEKENYILTDNSGNPLGKFSTFYYHYYLSAPFIITGKINKFWAGLGFNLNYYLNSRIKDQLNDVKDRLDSQRSFLLGAYFCMGIQEKINDKMYFHVFGYYNPIFSNLNSINYGINAGISFITGMTE